MAGKFMRRAAIVDLVKSEHRVNAMRKRSGLTRHPICGYVCGCPDEICGGWHQIEIARTIPTPGECKEALATNNQAKKAIKKSIKKASKVKRRKSTH
jgi:hypothetical protein